MLPLRLAFAAANGSSNQHAADIRLARTSNQIDAQLQTLILCKDGSDLQLNDCCFVCAVCCYRVSSFAMCANYNIVLIYQANQKKLKTSLNFRLPLIKIFWNYLHEVHTVFVYECSLKKLFPFLTWCSLVNPQFFGDHLDLLFILIELLNGSK